MKYIGTPAGMWVLFHRSFTDNLVTKFSYARKEAEEITKNAHRKYCEIIAKLPAFEKDDRFQMNIVSCAMLSAFVLSMPERPDVEMLTVYYRDAMMTEPMKPHTAP